MFRIIHMEKNFEEKIAITEDDKESSPAEDFCPPGFTVVSDSEYQEDLPSGFPPDYNWSKD